MPHRSSVGREIAMYLYKRTLWGHVHEGSDGDEEFTFLYKIARTTLRQNFRMVFMPSSVACTTNHSTSVRKSLKSLWTASFLLSSLSTFAPCCGYAAPPSDLAGEAVSTKNFLHGGLLYSQCHYPIGHPQAGTYGCFSCSRLLYTSQKMTLL